MPKRYVRFFLSMMTAVCAAAGIGCGTSTVKSSDAVMEIAGQTVVKEEYQMLVKSYSAQVKRDYSTGEANAEDFWTKEYQEGNPLAQVMELTQEDLCRRKVLAELAGEKGISQKTDYLSLMKELKEKSTGTQKATGEDTSYGLTAYEPGDYYNYVYTGLETQVLEALKQEQDISQEELQQIYEEDQTRYTSEVRVEMLVAEMRAESGEELAEQVAESLTAETDTDSLAGKYPDVNFYELTMSSLNTEEGKSGAYTARWQTAAAMEEGQVCTPFPIGDHILVMRCQKREEQAVEPFEEVRDVLKSQEQTRLAQEEISRREEAADIQLKVSEEQLEKIALEALE